ncbi:MAG: tRNA lysidine(34) synthetase TilS [Syntrophomonadaceae bacterium]|nr:tRNA lysidine(34) synthetase TilS [Syntrophomonadaceae bacterium]
MINQVCEFINEHRLIDPGDVVIAAVSGGSDSMALLFILKELAAVLGFQLRAAHVNHKLRSDADKEEQLVKDTCAAWNIELAVQHIAVAEIAQQKKESLELTGREQRYRFFKELSENYGGKIATAHHLDDLGESVLMHLLRGSGVQGLVGMKPGRDYLIRPLLDVTKEKILDFAVRNRIVFAEDKSNYNLSFTRNRIRHLLIPSLKKDFNPQIMTALKQLAAIAADEDEFIEQEVEKYWRQSLLEQTEDNISFKLEILLKLHAAGQRRILQRALRHMSNGRKNWEMRDIEKIRALFCQPGSSKKVNCKDSIIAYKIYDKLLLSKVMVSKQAFNYEINIPGSIICPEIKRRFYFDILSPKDFPETHCKYVLDYNYLEGKKIFLRSKQPGDTIKVNGLGHKKIKKILNELRIPFTDRNDIPLLATEDEVLGILGIMLSQLVTVSDRTGKILSVKTEKMN